ncbi:MAG: hypothetical protein J2P28_25870 [Actinobacteria bacterium]|nr:hypothetical protein [Actinomycetota bacterium]
MDSRFYETDPDDPEAPIVLTEYMGLKPGDRVTYIGHAPPWRANHRPVIAELVAWRGTYPHGTLAILDEGEWEVDADNLRKAHVES